MINVLGPPLSLACAVLELRAPSCQQLLGAGFMDGCLALLEVPTRAGGGCWPAPWALPPAPLYLRTLGHTGGLNLMGPLGGAS